MSHNENNPHSEEKVGYKNPPKNWQFKKGRSGNPKGRPKKRHGSLTDAIFQELLGIMKIRENGREIKVTKLRALAKTIVADAMRGKSKSLDILERAIEKSSQNYDMYPKIQIEVIDSTKPLAKDE
jgi:hypothetical protein